MLRMCLTMGLATAWTCLATADPLLDRVFAKADTKLEDGPLYVFDATYADANVSLTMTIDQSKPEGQRVIAMSPDETALEGDAAKTAAMLKQRSRGEIWCSSFAENLPADAERVSETDTTATYRFTPLPGEEDDGQMAKAFKYLTGQAVIDKETANILSFEMSAPKPFKPMMVAKIDKFDMRVACAPGPDGRTHVAEMSMDLFGKAMMQELKQSETRKISGLVPVPQSGTGSK